MMISVNFEQQLRKAFSAGQHSMLPRLMAAKGKTDDAAFLVSIPATYEEWIAREKKHHNSIARF